MENLEGLTIKYRDNIPRKEVQEAFKVYYETKDEKIRENLIYRYMPVAKKTILSLEIKDIEEEDLVQLAYEKLINCIDAYNPYSNVYFINYLIARLNCKDYYEYISNSQQISLSSLEIYSNENMEERLISDIIKNEVIKFINDFKSNLTPRQREVLNILINKSDISYTDVAETLGVSLERIRQLEKATCKRLYRAFYAKYPFIASKYSENYGVQEDYFPFYYSCDSLEDSHMVFMGTKIR